METMNAIAKRKSTRSFDPKKQVSKADLDKILAAGCAAPVGAGDYQSLHITVVQGELLESLAKEVQQAFHADTSPLYSAPVFVIVSALEEQKFPNIEYANVACVVANMLIAATDSGIDSVYIWGVTAGIANNKDVMNLLDIPNGYRPISGAVFGYGTAQNSDEKKLTISIPINYVQANMQS